MNIHAALVALLRTALLFGGAALWLYVLHVITSGTWTIVWLLTVPMSIFAYFQYRLIEYADYKKRKAAS